MTILLRLPQDLAGASVRFGDVGDAAALERAAFDQRVDVVVSCLASRTGGKARAPNKNHIPLPALYAWSPCAAAAHDCQSRSATLCPCQQ